ncbi:uncharacterized protein LOC143025361 isoform X2 [Oratosquilla oratoria]|uniref:uncharacterized protein LOC143025361 isoform X2 n=1 Tax=Oratosquilla oratoria TaxID=337810 RepID=UPI003F75D0C1
MHLMRNQLEPSIKVNCDKFQYNYEVSMAFIRPSGSASVKLLFNNPERHLYQATGNILINGVTAYCAASLRLMTDVTELDVDVRSSLMAEEYHLRFWRRENRHNEETLEYDFGGAVRQAGDAPDWVVSYRTILQTQKGYGGKSLVIRGRDELEIQRKGKPAERSSFWQVHAEKSIEMITIELTFPDLLPNHRLTAKLKNQLDIIFDIEFYTPSSKHKFEGRIDVGGRGPFQHMEGGSLHYTLEKGNERNHLTKVQVEGLWKDPTHIFFKFLFQKFHQPSIVNGEYSYNSVPPIVSVSTFEAEVIAKLESNRHIYELIWRIDDYDHSASFELENELKGTNGKILYQRFPKGVFNQEMRYEVNFNMRYFPSEVTASVTLEQSSIGRPRAITFSHSMSEGYTELVLDLFVEESDQIIVAITEEQEEFKLQIGQFGNTFLHVSYRVEKNKGTSIENHIIQLESSGRRIEALLGETGVDGVSCTVLSVVLRSPNISPTHHVATLCPQPSRQLILQVMGSEPGEGPYMRIGEMLGPGTVTLQLGTGRLQPLDTPPGLTVTANQKDDVLEVLINWDAAYLVQLQEELIARSSSVTSDLMNLEDSSFLLVTGTLGLHQLLEDTQMLLQEAQTKTSNMLSNVIFWLRELPMLQVDKILGLSGSRITWIWTTLTDMLRTVYRGPFLLLERVTGAYENFKAILDNWKDIAIGHLDPVMKNLEMKLSPIFYRMWAIFSFLHYNDDHSLYSLTWRAGRQVRHQIGRHVGFYGFFTNDFVTRIEREVLTALTWENLRSIGKNFIKQLGRFTTFSVEMLHDSSIQLQLPTPDKLQEDIIAVIHSVDVKSTSEMTRIFEHWARQTWSRFCYLTSWHIKGHAYIYGWDNAISWDGQHISSLVRSTCPYLLAYFTNAPTPSAITLQVKEDDHTGNWVRIITLYIGNSVISIDSNLRVLYNGKMIRQTEFMESGLTLHSSKEMATISVPSIDLIIEFNRKLDLCTISIGIFSFARVSGLLGVFDFEANTDAVGPSWELQNMRDAERWGGWQIENDDKCASTIPPVGITPQRPGQSLICQKHFEWQDSPLSFCFDHVSHTVYKEICEIGRPCAAFHTYDLICKQHFSFVDTNTISSLCDTCVKDETTQAETDLSREVVIVTSLECEDDIEDFLEYLNGEKGSANRVTVRYTGHKESVPDSVNKLTDVIFARGQTIPNALEDALDLDFSYRSLKAVFVFDCKSKECKTMTQPHMEKLRDRMLQEGVHMYITTQEGLSIINEDKLSKKAKRQLLGMDVQTTYTVPHARKRNVSGNKSLRPHVAVPENNVCAELAIQTNGAVFSRNFLKRHKKPYHHRVFHQLMGIRTIKGFDAEYLKCHTCNCQMPCQLCHPPEPFKFTSLGEDDIGKDDDDEVDDEEEEEEDEEVEEKQEKRAKLKKRKGKKLKKKQVS